jgi:magnesium transporter
VTADNSGRTDILGRALTASRLLTDRLPGSNTTREDGSDGVSFDPGKPLSHCVVDAALYEDGRRLPEVISPTDLKAQLAAHPDAFVWLGLHEPSNEALRSVAEQLDLPDLAVEDAVHAHQRPKVEEYDDSLFVAFRTTGYVDSIEVITTGEVMAFVGERYIVTVRHGDLGDLAGVRQTLEARPDLLALGPSAVLYAVTDRVVDGFAEAINGLAVDVDEVEAQVFSTQKSGTTERLYKLKREALELRRSVQPAPMVMQRLVDGAVNSEGSLRHINHKLVTYLRDVADHAQRSAENLTTIEELLWGAVQANLALVAKQQNDDMRRLAAGAAIFAVLTLIVGLYGMNFDNMPELHWKYGYFIVLGLMFVISVGLYRAFRKAGWL